MPPTTQLFDPAALLSFVAARTTSLRLGTYVYLLGLRHPFITARAFGTLDWVSGGRAVIGAGAGWLQAEWEALGIDPATQGGPARRGHRRVPPAVDRGDGRARRSALPLRRGGLRAQAGPAAHPDLHRRRVAAGAAPGRPAGRRLDRHDPHARLGGGPAGRHPGRARAGRPARPALRGHGRRRVRQRGRRGGVGGRRGRPPHRVALAPLAQRRSMRWPPSRRASSKSAA